MELSGPQNIDFREVCVSVHDSLPQEYTVEVDTVSSGISLANRPEAISPSNTQKPTPFNS